MSSHRCSYLAVVEVYSFGQLQLTVLTVIKREFRQFRKFVQTVFARRIEEFVRHFGSEDNAFFGSFVRRRSTSAIVACLSPSFVRRTVASSDIFVDELCM